MWHTNMEKYLENNLDKTSNHGTLSLVLQHLQVHYKKLHGTPRIITT